MYGKQIPLFDTWKKSPSRMPAGNWIEFSEM
jgi:hypothetical protein